MHTYMLVNFVEALGLHSFGKFIFAAHQLLRDSGVRDGKALYLSICEQFVFGEEGV